MSASTWLVKEKWAAALLSSHEWLVALNHAGSKHNESILLKAAYEKSFKDVIPSEILALRKKVI